MGERQPPVDLGFGHRVLASLFAPPVEIAFIHVKASSYCDHARAC
jgi:hypothetical protein